MIQGYLTSKTYRFEGAYSSKIAEEAHVQRLLVAYMSLHPIPSAAQELVQKPSAQKHEVPHSLHKRDHCN